jgi:hypothetical protein
MLANLLPKHASQKYAGVRYICLVTCASVNFAFAYSRPYFMVMKETNVLSAATVEDAAHDQCVARAVFMTLLTISSQSRRFQLSHFAQCFCAFSTYAAFFRNAAFSYAAESKA